MDPYTVLLLQVILLWSMIGGLIVLIIARQVWLRWERSHRARRGPETVTKL